MAELRGTLIPKVEEETITGLVSSVGTDGAAYSQLFRENQGPLFDFCQVVAYQLMPEQTRRIEAFMDVASIGYLALEEEMARPPQSDPGGIQPGMPWIYDAEHHRQRVSTQHQTLISDYAHFQPQLLYHLRDYGRNSGLERTELLELTGVAAFIHNAIAYELEFRVLNSWYYGPSSADRLLDGTDEVY